MTVNIVYLHGFASSPQSKKAQDMRERLKPYDVHFTVPDLNVPSFEQLNFTAILEKVAQTVRNLPDGPVYLIGSSMGGSVALHFADRYRDAEAKRVEKMILLAPAIDFFANRQRQLGDNWLQQWKAAGSIPFYHYGYAVEKPVHYGLIEDLQQYDGYSVKLDIPIRIYHGRHDDSVDCQQSERYAQENSNVELHILDSDHTLLDKTDVIFEGVVAFFGLGEHNNG